MKLILDYLVQRIPDVNASGTCIILQAIPPPGTLKHSLLTPWMVFFPLLLTERLWKLLHICPSGFLQPGVYLRNSFDENCPNMFDQSVEVIFPLMNSVCSNRVEPVKFALIGTELPGCQISGAVHALNPVEICLPGTG